MALLTEKQVRRAAHPGHRDNPVEVVRPGDLDRAVRRAWDPTPAQAAAGNYKMAHVVVGGLDVAIETPKDRVRSGVGPDGRPWSVRMPAAYGYVKKTEASDGDAVDVYIGDDAHRATELPVWVIDQCDAETGAYDEAKCMLGFGDVSAAKRSYLAAFSDGKGHRRAGGVTRMTFGEFRRWLDQGRTTRPLVMKSASAPVIAASYGPATCQCDTCTGKSRMTETAKAAITPGDASLMTRLIAKGVQSLSAEERATMMADASQQASSLLAKAKEITMVGDDHDKIGHVEDLWDGPPDDKAETTRAHGPDSSAAPGKVPTGPGQSASGNGAEKMEREYSRHAEQTGVQRATEELGEAVMGMGKSMRAIRKGNALLIGAIEAQGLQIEALKAGAAPALTEASVKAMIDASLAKSFGGLDIGKVVSKAVRQALAKAEEDKEDDKDDEDDKETESFKAKDEEGEEDEEDEEADQEEEGGGTKIEIDNDVEDDDDDEDEASKAIAAKAAELRQMAKNRLTWVDRRIAKAVKLQKAGKAKAAARHASMAKANINKAVTYAEAAKALTGTGGKGTKWLGKAIAKAKGKLPSGAKNQDIWPASNDSKVGTGKSAEVDKGATPPSVQAMTEAADKLSKAASGVGLLLTDMSGLMSVFAGQSKGDGVPPAFALAKANPDTLAAKREQISKLHDDNVIDFDQRTRGIEVLNMAASKAAPPEYLNGLIARLPEKVQQILLPAA